MYNYENYVNPHSKNFIHIKLTNEDVNKIDEFARYVIIEKSNENHHKIDNNSEYKRFYTGTMGELALEKYLGVSNIVDWSIGGSNKFHTPDLRNLGIKCGVKTVTHGSFPLIFKNSYSSEIMMIRWKHNHIYICGVATPDILNKHQSDDLILDNKLRLRGTKTGFYGFEHLKQFKDLEDIKTIIK